MTASFHALPIFCHTYSARAFLGSFESCLTWLRETERKIQRDDPLKLEVRDLTTGLTHLKVTISSAHLVINVFVLFG